MASCNESWLSWCGAGSWVSNILCMMGTVRDFCTVLNMCHACTATHYNTLQHTATHCDTLQHTATHCNALQRTATHRRCIMSHIHTATHCNTLQRTATHCNTLQRTATHCNTLQRTAMHCHAPQMHNESYPTYMSASCHICVSHLCRTYE